MLGSASLRLTRVADIDIKVHVSFLIVVALGAMQWGQGFGLRGVVFGILSTVLLFVCVTLHELGHSLVAQRFGIPVREITLWPFGGIAQLGARPKLPKHELLISLAGPAVNVVIAAVMLAIGLAWLGPHALRQELLLVGKVPPTLTTLLALMLGSNVILAVFNMIPALPMDGGRVLRSLLAMKWGALKATNLAAFTARCIAVAMFMGAIIGGQLMLGVIAFVVFFGAGREAAEQRAGMVLNDVRAGAAVNPNAVVLSPATSVGEALKLMMSTGQIAFAVMHFGRLLGVIARDAMIKTATDEGPNAYVAGAMLRTYPHVDGQATLEDARQKMAAAVTPFVVVNDGERFVGLVTEADLVRHLTPAQPAGAGVAPVGEPRWGAR